VSVVIVRHEDKFCVTDEKQGFYLPAGRVDYGETFTTAAIREAKEEAGVDIELDGILRVEHSAFPEYSRMRVIFAAHSKDPTQPLKSKPDKHSNGAHWMTLQEVSQLHEKGKLRTVEPLLYFQWINTGTKIHPLSFLEGKDGTSTNSEQVIFQIVYGIDLLVKKNDHFLIIKGDQKEDDSEAHWTLPSCVMTKPTKFLYAAKMLLKELEIEGTVKGVVRLRHEAPYGRRYGFVKVTYLAAVEDKQGVDEKNSKKQRLQAISYSKNWILLEESSKYRLSSGLIELIRKSESNVFSNNLIAAEGDSVKLIT